MNQAIADAIAVVGSGAALASAIDRSPQFVSQMLKGEDEEGGRPVPAELCPAIERATGGRVRCEELRPDVAWDVLRMQTNEKQAA